MPEKVKEVKKLEMKEEEEKEDKDLGSYFDTRSRVVETDFTSDMQKQQSEDVRNYQSHSKNISSATLNKLPDKKFQEDKLIDNKFTENKFTENKFQDNMIPSLQRV